MIELLAVQAITTAALAFFVIKLRRELYPMIATAGPVDAGFWIRSIDVLVLAAPQFEVSKTVIKARWLFSEELFLKHSLRVYDVAMRPGSRSFYRKWRAWLSGNDRYRCLEKKPRGLARLYSKAIDVVCYDMENERSRKLWEVIEIATAGRRRRKHKT
jgi:hypothetical protein